MLKFDDELIVQTDGSVEAMGPVDLEKEEVVELCAWVFQRRDKKDAAVTEMATPEGHPHGRGSGTDLKVVPDKNGKGKWKLPLGKVGQGPEKLEAGEAFGVAVAMTKKKGTDEQVVVWWGHPLELVQG
jgi:hypothetical protein